MSKAAMYGMIGALSITIGTYVCPHTDGNHTQDCLYWNVNHHAEDESYDSGHHGGSHHGSGHHGGSHHGSGHHGGSHHGSGHHGSRH